jgi:hypothetical protein
MASTMILTQHYYMRVTWLELQVFIQTSYVKSLQDELAQLRLQAPPNQPPDAPPPQEGGLTV